MEENPPFGNETMKPGKRNIVTAILSRKELIFMLRLVLGVTFLYASYDKILQPYPFTIAVRAYEIIPTPLSNLFAIMVAWSELVAGLLILIGLFTRQAAGALFILTAMFIVAISISIARGMAIDCGCFGSGDSDHPVDLSLLIRDFLLLGAAYLVMRFDSGFLSVSALSSSRG